MLEVRLIKESAETKIGLRLEDRKSDGLPKIVTIAPGGAAAVGGQLRKGDVLISVNGQDVRGHKRAAEVLREASGDIQLVVQRSGSSRSSIFRRSSNYTATGKVVTVAANAATSVHEFQVETEKPTGDFDENLEQHNAAVKMQAGVRGNLARKHIVDSAVVERAKEPFANEFDLVTEPCKRSSKDVDGFGFAKKKACGPSMWEDTYEVTLHRAEDSYKVSCLLLHYW